MQLPRFGKKLDSQLIKTQDKGKFMRIQENKQTDYLDRMIRNSATFGAFESSGMGGSNVSEVSAPLQWQGQIDSKKDDYSNRRMEVLSFDP